jgi:hypothetical protein
MKYKRFFTYFCPVVLAIAVGPLLEPCWGGKARTQVGTGADFSSYKTYSWLPTKVLTETGVVENHPVLGPLIKDAINKQLAKCGLKEVAEGGDLQVVAGALTASNPQLEAVFFTAPTWTVYDTPTATMGRYNKEGTLVVNLIDTKTKKSAWSGMITESIDNKPGGGQKKIGPAAEKLFKKYPSKK